MLAKDRGRVLLRFEHHDAFVVHGKLAQLRGTVRLERALFERLEVRVVRVVAVADGAEIRFERRVERGLRRSGVERFAEVRKCPRDHDPEPDPDRNEDRERAARRRVASRDDHRS